MPIRLSARSKSPRARRFPTLSLESLESRQLLTLAVPSLSKVHAAVPLIAPTAHVSSQNHHFHSPRPEFTHASRPGFATRANLVFNRFDPSNGLRTAKPLTGTAGFVGVDTTTVGTWSPTYGGGGYVLTNGVASTPAYATVTPSGQSFYTWSSNTTDVRGLLTAPNATTRRADTWYGQTFSIDVNLTDGKPHNVSFYAIDWDSTQRSERFDVVDPSTNTVLDSRTISGFSGGEYLTWTLSGHVQVRVTNLNGANAVVSGVFFAGSTPPPTGGTAGFVGADTTTAGTWSPTYGGDGYVLTNGVASTPAYATVTPSGQSFYTWSSNTTDVRGLLTAPNATTRRADTWYGQTFSIDVNLTDGKPHNVSFYAIDWDSTQRSERFDVVDPSTNTVLDSRTISGFSGGEYLTWTLSGHVQVRVTNLNGANAVVSGVFFAGSSTAQPGPPVPAPYVPAQMRHAYGVDQLSQSGLGQTIAIIDAYDDPTAISDFNTFSTKYGLPTGNLIKATPQGVPVADAGWSTEIALDVEWAHAMAPNATILLVEAKSNSFNDLLGAVDYAVAQGAKQVSMSFGGTDFAGENIYDTHFNHPGVTFIASAGDSGTEAEYPAASPYVTSVGGTRISLDAAGNKLSETSWSGSGGALTVNESKPSYQNGFFTGNGRGIPDVAYNAEPSSGVPIFVNGSWGSVGGTSAGAPQWAGIMALVNQGRASLGKSSIGTGTTFGTNQALYTLAGGSSYTNPGGDFYDVTTGGNGLNAGTGYDFVTGLGTPVANKLVPDLIKS